MNNSQKEDKRLRHLNAKSQKRKKKKNRTTCKHFIKKAKQLFQRREATPSVAFPRATQKSTGIEIYRLHHEIEDFFMQMSPSFEELELRHQIILKVRKVIQNAWPSPMARVEVHGSFRTGLFLPSSDIDLVIFGYWNEPPLRTCEILLRRSDIEIGEMTVIPNATVPIISFTHRSSKIKVDICFNEENCLRSADLIKDYITKYPPLPKLVFVLKQFLIKHDLNIVYHGGMGSYCLTLLVINLLQMKPEAESNNLNLGVLLMEFFELYGINFNYKKVSINIKDCCYVKKHNPFYQKPVLTVYDPLNPGRNVSKSTFLIKKIRSCFQHAYHVLHRSMIGCISSPESILRQIVDIDNAVINNRMVIHRNYGKIMKRLQN